MEMVPINDWVLNRNSKISTLRPDLIKYLIYDDFYFKIIYLIRLVMRGPFIKKEKKIILNH